jgi:hypothetical protein
VLILGTIFFFPEREFDHFRDHRLYLKQNWCSFSVSSIFLVYVRNNVGWNGSFDFLYWQGRASAKRDFGLSQFLNAYTCVMAHLAPLVPWKLAYYRCGINKSELVWLHIYCTMKTMREPQKQIFSELSRIPNYIILFQKSSQLIFLLNLLYT